MAKGFTAVSEGSCNFERVRLLSINSNRNHNIQVVHVDYNFYILLGF
jgi:hypothetical protein